MRAFHFQQLAVSSFCLLTYLGGVFAQETAIEPEVGVYDWGCVGNCFATLNATAQVSCPTSDNENGMFNCVTGCSADVSAQNMYVAGWEIQNLKENAPACQPGANATLSTVAVNATSTQSVATTLSSEITSATTTKEATKSTDASGGSGADASATDSSSSNSAPGSIAKSAVAQFLVVVSIIVTLFL